MRSLSSIDAGHPSAVTGIGTDIEDIQRFAKHLGPRSEPDELIREIFTEGEIHINTLSPDPAFSYTAGYCCKEAVFKAIGRSWMNASIGWKDIELLFSDSGEFTIHTSPKVSTLLEKPGKLMISGELIPCDGFIVFNALIVS
jgi:phosphopantetheine--protein transferase-like protein